MTDRHYFVNCRGADFFPSYESVWEKSGHMPTIARTLFQGMTSSMDSDGLIYNGATIASTWIHFNEEEITEQIGYLKDIGINLLRIRLDMYCWAVLGSKFLERVEKISKIADKKKIYIQWVLFEAETYNDLSGVDPRGRAHESGGLDPNSLEEAIINGLHHYQRCPTVYKTYLVSRHPSAMDVSGNKYISDVVSTVGKYKSTLSWEVMANINFNPYSNPADENAYGFVFSAIKKTKSLIPAKQKVTSSFKKVKVGSSTSKDTSAYPAIYSSLDYICYQNSNGGFIDRLVNYADALSAATKFSKPLMVVGITKASNLDHLNTEVSSFSALNIGFITDGIIDRNIGAKPNNSDRGIFYADGTVRDIRYVSAIKTKTYSDYRLPENMFYGRRKTLINKFLTKQISEKTDYENQTIQGLSFDSNTMTRFSQWGTEGYDFWNYLKEMLGRIPEFNSFDNGDVLNLYLNPNETYKVLATKYAPYGNNSYSKELGYSISNKNNFLDKNDLSKLLSSEFIQSIDPYFNPLNALYPIYALYDTTRKTLSNLITFSGINNQKPGLGIGDFLRDRLCTFKIELLEKFQRALPVSAFNPGATSSYPNNIISQSNLTNLFNQYLPFAPSSSFKNNVSSITPYVGTPRYLSGIQHYVYDAAYTSGAQYMRPFSPALSACQKPVCYFLRRDDTPSGSCFYIKSAAINPNVTAVQDVLSMLDWEKYDTALYNWYFAIILCWVDVIVNSPTYIETLKSFINSSFNNSTRKPNLDGVI